MVGVIDMIGKTRSLGSVTGHTLEGYIICALVFAVLSPVSYTHLCVATLKEILWLLGCL